MSLRASFGAVSFALSLAAIVAGCGAPQQRPDGGSGPLTVGVQAPDLRAVDQTGTARSISAERGHVLVVYFYPKDETPGCTKEACAFRDSWTKLSEGGVMVYGVSADDAASHAAFAKKYSLPFPLIADTDQAWAKAFGVGSTLGMYKRISFLIGPDGKIAKVYPDVNPAMHADEVLADALVLPKLARRPLAWPASAVADPRATWAPTQALDYRAEPAIGLLARVTVERRDARRNRGAAAVVVGEWERVWFARSRWWGP